METITDASIYLSLSVSLTTNKKVGALDWVARLPLYWYSKMFEVGVCGAVPVSHQPPHIHTHAHTLTHSHSHTHTLTHTHTHTHST
jgi:hypothetical protein